MKPDSESYGINTRLTQNSPPVNKSNKTPITSNPRQQLKPPLSKTLKQQIDNISRQQWISDAAYYKAEARGFIPGHEHTDWLEAEHGYIEMLVDLFLSVFGEDGSMSMVGLRQLAKAIGVNNPGSIESEPELIRLIQTASHHDPCFRAKTGKFCEDQAGCQWESECQKLVAEWRR
jgi:hypothetical protein